MIKTNIMVCKTCSVCNNKSNQPAFKEKLYFCGGLKPCGNFDLDFRLHKPDDHFKKLNTLQECPYCGYVSNNLEEKTNLSIDFFDSMNYKTCDGIDFKSNHAAKCYKRYLIYKESNELFFSFQYIQLCAWACDDENDIENSKIIRKIGINLINEILESENKVLLTDDWLAIKFDWMRRIGDFEELINACKDINLKDRTWSTFLQFQLDKAKNKDSSCYSMHDANHWNKEEGI